MSTQLTIPEADSLFSAKKTVENQLSSNILDLSGKIGKKIFKTTILRINKVNIDRLKYILRIQSNYINQDDLKQSIVFNQFTNSLVNHQENKTLSRNFSNNLSILDVINKDFVTVSTKVNVDEIDNAFSRWTQANLWLKDDTFSSNPAQDYNPSSTTFVLTHGFLGSIQDQIYKSIGSAIHDFFDFFLTDSDVNVVLWEWSDKAGDNFFDYTRASSNVIEVGAEVAGFLLDVKANPNDINLVGFSLGAHVMGNAGDTYQLMTSDSLNTIAGLDPAGPGFESDDSFLAQKTNRLDSSDADRVVALHTSSILGYDGLLGDLDLYVNYFDFFQPGQSNFIENHSYSQQLFQELFEGESFSQGSGNIIENFTPLIGTNFNIIDIYGNATGIDFVQTNVVI